jgi:hypothetical protein
VASPPQAPEANAICGRMTGALRGGAPVKAGGEFPLRQVGCYLASYSYVVQLWCTDAKTRREAALQRVLEYADAGRRDEAEITRFLKRPSAASSAPEASGSFPAAWTPPERIPPRRVTGSPKPASQSYCDILERYTSLRRGDRRARG